MTQPQEFSEHQRPFVNSLGEVDVSFYEPLMTDLQYSRYTTLPPFDLKEAIIRVRRFEDEGYRDIAGIIFSRINPVTGELTTNMQAEACLPNYPLIYDGALRGPYLSANDHGEIVQEYGFKLYKKIGTLPAAVVFSELFETDVDTFHRLRTKPLLRHKSTGHRGGYK